MRFRLDVRFVKIAGCVLAALVLLLGGVLGIRAWEEAHAGVPQSVLDAANAGQDRALVQYNGGTYAPKKRLETTLVMGVDKYADEQKQDVQGEYEQADFLLLLIMDREAEACTALHLNRDTMTEIQMLTDAGAVARTFVGQLTLAHTYGGTAKLNCENTVAAVSNLLENVKIDHYLSLTMDGVVKLNDLVGGVTVEVLDDFSGIDDTLEQGKTVTLKGQQALTYVRARSGLEDSSNLRRMERQHQYLEALQRQLTAGAESREDFTLSALMEVNDYMVSDYSVEQLSDFSERLEDYGVSEYRTLEGEAVVGDEFMEFYPDGEKLKEMVMELFYERVGDA